MDSVDPLTLTCKTIVSKKKGTACGVSSSITVTEARSRSSSTLPLSLLGDEAVGGCGLTPWRPVPLRQSVAPSPQAHAPSTPPQAQAPLCRPSPAACCRAIADPSGRVAWPRRPRSSELGRMIGGTSSPFLRRLSRRSCSSILLSRNMRGDRTGIKQKTKKVRRAWCRRSAN